MTVIPRGVRAQITVCVAVLVMLVVAAAGLVITLRIDHRDREDVDRQLIGRAQKVQEDTEKLLSGGNQRNDDYGGLLAGSASLVRLLSGGQVVAARGEEPRAPLPLPDADGFSTVTAGGQIWRSLVLPLDNGAGHLQVLQNLDSLEHRLADNRRVAIVVAIIATAVAAAGVWLIAGLVLAPLQRLRAGARRILPGEVGQRLPEVHRPREVADLSATLNGMLERLQDSMLATRRFTADAGHELRTPLTGLGMDLETLRRHPELPDADRVRTLDAMAVEHHRIVTLLDGLQALARGDAAALPAPGLVDLADLVRAAVVRARQRHSGVTYQVHGASAVVSGWDAGLRLAVDNLLDNAALHGRPHGTVDVSVWTDGHEVRIAVADDGPGIPLDRREDVKRRFARGEHPRGNGSGLGLALVDQQAHLHGGTLTLGDAPGGGLLATLTAPAGRDS
ncbi:ATP-binding protein [Lentzea sp. NPDC051213]|uniref:HAMP domain-containing sensor histidine kinase n=1 Tax=Lentzea sp. NPDC051213 TaxID=3364126 RepID=UPI003787AAFD